MIRNPREPDPQFIRRTDSTHPFHDKLRKTLVLLQIEARDGPVFFVVEGLAPWPLDDGETLATRNRYFYEEHTCPTNFIRVPLISHRGNNDPHGVFKFVDAVWMMDEYDSEDCEEYLTEVFPQIITAATSDKLDG